MIYAYMHTYRYTLELDGCSAEVAQQMYEKAHLLAMYQGNKVRLHILFVRAIGICIHILSVHRHIYIGGRGQHA